MGPKKKHFLETEGLDVSHFNGKNLPDIPDA
jgi:hypothetical protein